VKTLTNYNKLYRKGEPIVSDEYYDKLYEELKALDPENPFLKKIGEKVSLAEREEPIPFSMGTLPKLTSSSELLKWIVNTGAHTVTFTGKYDGVSITCNEQSKKAWTRGDGITGSNVTAHLEVAEGKGSDVVVGNPDFTFGEMMFSKKKFEKYSDEYSMSRNMIIGKLRNDAPEEVLEDATYIRYGVHQSDGLFQTKSQMLKYLNSKFNGLYKVPYHKVNTLDAVGDFEETLKTWYDTWSKDFDLDGLVVTVEKLEKDGTEISAAYKAGFDTVKEVTVKAVNWQVTKNGLLKPVMEIEPTVLDGAEITNIFVDNAATVKELGIGKGAVVNIKRSGKVIPRVVDVVINASVYIPKLCPSCRERTIRESVDVKCINKHCPEQRTRKTLAFFEILGVDKVGYSAAQDLTAFGSINQIINTALNHQDRLLKLDGWGIKGATTLKENLAERLETVSIPIIQHASGHFSGLGSTRLKAIYSKFGLNEVPMADLTALDGISETLATIYIKGYPKFLKFFDSLERIEGVNISGAVEELESTSLEDMVVVFTGVRDNELQALIELNGGTIGRGVTKKTTHLVAKGEGTTKWNKAVELGIPTFTLENFKIYVHEHYGIG